MAGERGSEDGSGSAPERDAVRAARNEILLRKYNEHLERDRLRVQPQMAEWLCECADEDCAQAVKLSIAEYEEVRSEATQFLVAPGPDHVDPAIESVVRRTERYWVVAKVGVAADMAEAAQDPRRY